MLRKLKIHTLCLDNQRKSFPDIALINFPNDTTKKELLKTKTMVNKERDFYRNIFVVIHATNEDRIVD